MRAVIRRKGRLILDDMETPPLGEGLVRCRTLACGICGSDLHALDHLDRVMRMAPGAAAADPDADIVFGHEFCCEVLESGPGTTRGLKAGTRVCSIPVAQGPAGLETIGYSARLPGGFAEQMLLMEALLLEVPNGLSAEHAALSEPLAVGEHAVAMATPEANAVYLVIGCGPVGLAVITSLKARGVGPVVASDFSAPRRALAERMGADRVVDPAEASPHASWAEYGVPSTRMEAMMAQMMGQTLKKPIIFECVGMPGVIQNLAQDAPAGARIVVVGVCMETDAIEPLLFIVKEIELRFVLGYSPAEFAASLNRLANGETNYPEIVTSVVSLAATPDAFVKLQTDKSEVKIMVAPGS
jgi:threonine dehydrogenase-like Zn-dependent dehydrogenase